MDAPVIIKLPVCLLIFGIALLLLLIDRFKKTGTGILTILSGLLVLIGTAYALLMGAPVFEGITLLLLFTVLFMGVKE